MVMKFTKEVAVWSYLADKWHRAGVDGDDVVHIDGYLLCGLCACLSTLYDFDFIDDDLVLSMRDRMNKHQPRRRTGHFSAWWWSPTPRGSFYRARFCRKMAALASQLSKEK